MKLFKKTRKKQIEIINNNCIYTPIEGKLLPIEDVEDQVFSSKMMGDGIAIIPTDEYLYSPIDGEVVVVFPTKHALGIKGDNGVDLIIHVGIDTVQLNGQGFTSYVKVGDKVNIGQRLMKINLKMIQKKFSTTTMIVIENTHEFEIKKSNLKQVSVGDELMIFKRRLYEDS